MSDLADLRERLAALLGVEIPAEERPVWQVITRLGGALLDELLYQDARTAARLRELSELVLAAQGLLGPARLEQERAQLQAARGGLLSHLEARGRELEAQERERLRALAERLALEREQEAAAPELRRPAPVPRPEQLPALAGLEERLLYLRSWRLPEGLQPNHVADLLGDGVKITTMAGWARRYGVPPRWLAVGEDVLGDDPGGFGARLQQAREAARLTRRGLGDQAGVSNSLISMYEAGYRATGSRSTVSRDGAGEPMVPRLQTVLQLAAVLGVSPGWLAYGDC